MAWTATAVVLCLVAFTTATTLARSKRQSNDEFCVCVEYYSCSEDDKVITDGSGALDQRIGSAQRKTELCPGVQVCCGLPNGWHVDGNGQIVEGDGVRNPGPNPGTVINPGPEVNNPDNGGNFPGDKTTNPEGPNSGQPLNIKVPQRPSGLTGCGIKRVLPFGDLEDRITGPNGEPRSTFFGEFPWMVALLVKDKAGQESFACGGSLIAPDVVLTGAHCVHDKIPAEVRVVAGDWDSRIEDEPIRPQNRLVTRIVKHDDFNSDNLVNDIALLMMETPFQMTEVVDTICLAKERFNPTDCQVTGWGRNRFDEAGRYQPTLKRVHVPLVDRDTCQAKLRTTRVGQFFKLHESFLCAGGNKDADACTGDGGGPLVCGNYRGDQQIFAQVGIVAWGIECGIGNPGVYTDVSKFIDWIKRHAPHV